MITMDSYVNTALIAALFAVIGWIGRRAIQQLDTISQRTGEMVVHLAMLNHRTEKLEARMTLEEARESK